MDSKLESLERLIPQYAANKSELDGYKALCDEENKAIKDVMGSYALQHYTAGGYKAVRTVQKRESMNEELLLEIAHKHGLTDIIKTREYIDYDALENALYNDRIPKAVIEEMDNAKEVKFVVTLKVSKVKAKE